MSYYRECELYCSYHGPEGYDTVYFIFKQFSHGLSAAWSVWINKGFSCNLGRRRKKVLCSCSVSNRSHNTGACAVLGRTYESENKHLTLLVNSCLDCIQCETGERLQMANDVIHVKRARHGTVVSIDRRSLICVMCQCSTSVFGEHFSAWDSSWTAVQGQCNLRAGIC